MKKLLLGFFALLAVCVVIVYVSLGSILKKGLATYGPKMLGAPVSVGLVTVSPFSGEGTIRELKIGNPPGFTTPHAITVGSVKLALSVKSLLGNGRMLVKEIIVEQPGITLETGKDGTNLQALERHLNAYAPADRQDAGKTQGRKVEIARFRLRGGKATVVVSQLSSKPTTVSIPDLELTGIGRSGGATTADVSKQILSAVTQAAMRSAGGVDQLLQRGVEAIGGKDAAQKLEGLKKLFK